MDCLHHRLAAGVVVSRVSTGSSRMWAAGCATTGWSWAYSCAWWGPRSSRLRRTQPHPRLPLFGAPPLPAVPTDPPLRRALLKQPLAARPPQ